MELLLSSRMVLGLAAATTALVLLAGCDRRPTDVPPPTTGEMERDRDRTTNPPMPSAPAVPTPETSPAPPASSPATPAPGGTTP